MSLVVSLDTNLLSLASALLALYSALRAYTSQKKSNSAYGSLSSNGVDSRNFKKIGSPSTEFPQAVLKKSSEILRILGALAFKKIQIRDIAAVENLAFKKI